jgi:cob(I)alamin adenosyltransferase
MIQVYTGGGKGKTTAALGLALRAAGAGKKVLVCQFLKGRYCCELASLKKFKNIRVERFGRRCLIRKKPAEKDVALAKKALASAGEAVAGGRCDVLILDELNVALSLGILKLEEALGFIRSVPANIELIITGRNAPAEIIKIADLVSEIKEVKHYYRNGVKARKGIEF